MVWLFAARTIMLSAPPASAALVALGRPGISFGANLATSLGLLPFLPLLMQHFGLAGAGAFALFQAFAAAAMLTVLLWRETSSPVPV